MKLKLNAETWKNLDRNNAYFKFIDECRNKTYSDDTQMQLHHIIPKYVFKSNASAEDIEFRDSLENLIALSVADHIKAHELLYAIYENEQDKGATLMLSNWEDESRSIWKKLGAEATHKLMRERGQTFWSSDYQKEMSRRSLSRPDAIETRRKGGRVGGINVHLNIAIKKTNKYVFSYNGIPVLCIINCNLGTHVIDELNKHQPTKIARVSPLLNGSRKTAYGWSCVRLNDDGSPIEQA